MECLLPMVFHVDAIESIQLLIGSIFMAGDGRSASSNKKGPGLKGDKKERRGQGLCKGRS